MENSKLREIILERIGDGQISFAEFMEMCLYYPEEGYYTNRANLIGARGDFYTATHLTPVFGQLIGRQLAEMWQRLGQPEHFTVVELGAGQGLLASDVLGWLYQHHRDMWTGLEYIIVEISPSLQQGQQRRLASVPEGERQLEKVRWQSLADFAAGSVTGCFFSNELFDALPVHLFMIMGGKLQEIYVKVDKEEQLQLKEVVGEPSTPALQMYLDQHKLDLSQYEDGYRNEISLGAPKLLGQMADKLKQGYILTIDYGYTAEKRYHPRRNAGTLQCYYNHQVGHNPYEHIGQQDITAHVDFSGLIQAGAAHSLVNLGLTTQGNFLAGLGIGELMRELTSPTYAQQSGKTVKEILTEHTALHTLINPNQMGNFGVLVQGKGVNQETALAGLQFVQL